MAELCARLEVEQPDVPGGQGVIYVKSRWFTTKFSLYISDGLDAWICEASEEEVSRKAFSWDDTVTEYLEQAEQCLGAQKPSSTYSFISIGDGARKFSWTREKDGDGVELAAHWKVEKSRNPKETTCDILDCLMRGSSRLSEELLRKNRSFEHMKAEAERAQAQSQKFADQKIQFEADIYRKFVAVLNSKKAKLRQLRELALHALPSEANKGKDKLVDETESEDELDESNEDDDCPSHNERPVDDCVQVANEDSGATEIVPPESPAGDVTSVDYGLSHPVFHGDSKNQDEDQKPEASDASIGTLKRDAESVTDAATLLSGSTYTSAPRKRRRV